ncbi:hypothetical protein POTOM_014574 [Populus tomentosa]|uniref:Rx N-terminal domain-containing protein n=1 Tax=Populus tomentosa TaxID=118781 RepID=A0A8X8A280_POPTO|nr:hypothetical protein POTOM_014574 [Populus tomentosa]
MAEAFLSAFFNVVLERMASRQVVNFFRGQKVNNRLLERLGTAMRSASRVLDDAEEKQITSTAVWDWLAELKDAVYKADDFLDAIAYKALRQELKAEDQTFICHMQRFLSFFNLCKKGLGEIEEELKVLLQDLDRLVDRTVALGLISRTGKEPSWPKTPGETSLVDERGVYGRDDDKEAILKLLLSDDANGQSLDASMLSCSTRKLKHLRYLDLSGSDLVTLPEEVSALLNLQTLILQLCYRLASLPDLGNLKQLRRLNLERTRIERLPESLERLINLRYLNIIGTPLKEMPPHIGQLTKLQTLNYFLVGRQSETSIKELGKLRHLRGDLHIRNLQNVVNARDAGEANLKGKKHLDELRFTWDGDTHDPQHVTSTMEKLEPNRNVKDLQIDGYGGIRFPEWVGESSFSKIVSLELSRCTNCTSLPPLGQLASLEVLSIEGFDKVVTVGSEFYGHCTAMKKPFESLKTLSFRGMPDWREWISDKGSREAFPLLEGLSIKECPNLTKALPGHNLPRLTSLIIEGCEQLATPLPRIPRLLSLDVSGCHSLESLPGEIVQMDLEGIEIKDCASLKCVALDLLPKLNSLSIFNCPDLESLCAHERPLNDLTSLHSLSIWGCPKLVSFPKGGLPAPVLTRLELNHCYNLKQLPESMHSLLPSLESLEIRGCLEVELCPEGGFPSTLQSLEIRNCNKLIAGRMQWGLQTLPSLSHFKISWDENVESFPEEMLLPSSLTSLTIYGLEHQKYLDYKGLQHLTSLSTLVISYCSMLKSLPRLHHLTSLTRLEISNCPLIESMLEEGLPSSLSFLRIDSCPMLKSLPRLQHLTSLREFTIWGCPLIESMPEEGLPSSLSTLSIYHCPTLGESCEKEIGKDWPKVSHIPHIRICP